MGQIGVFLVPAANQALVIRDKSRHGENHGTNRRPQNQGPKRVVDYYQSRSLKRTFVIVEEIGER